MKMKFTVACIGLMMASGGALAQDIDYTYVEGGFQTITGSPSPSGVFVDGSYRITDEIYAAGGLQWLSASGVDFNLLTLRGGYIFPLSDNMDVYAEGGLANARAKASVRTEFGSFSSSVSDTGLLLGGGVRMALNEELEVHGGARLITTFSDEFYLTGGAAYEFMPNLRAVGSLSVLLDASEFQLQAGVRYSF